MVKPIVKVRKYKTKNKAFKNIKRITKTKKARIKV